MAPDDYPFGESRMPPTIALYDTATKRYTEDEILFCEKVVAERGADSADAAQVTSGDITTMYYKDTQFAFHLDGSELVKVHSINAPRRSDDGFVMINVLLYADGSPFVRDADLEYIDGRPLDFYTVILAAERPPFIVTYAELEGPFGPHELAFSPASYLKHLRHEGRSPRDLTEPEAQELLEILPQLELDPDLTLASI